MTAMLSPDKGTHFPAHYRWPREKYDQAVARGVFGPDNKIELIEGEIVHKIPQNDPHRTGIGAMQEALGAIFRKGYWLCIQLPISLGDWSKPEPDLAVVIGSWRDYAGRAPTAEATRLVVEVSDSSLLYDQTQKASVYARASIPDYWILNLVEQVLEVRRRPVPQESAPFGYGYTDIQRLAPGASIVPLAAESDAAIVVAELFP